MKEAKKFWRLLNNSFDRMSTMFYWTYILGDAFPFVKTFLYPGDMLAENYPNPNNPDGKWLYVVHYPNGSIGAISEDREIRIPLEQKDILYHCLNMSRFRKMIAETLGLELVTNNIEQTDRVICLGNYEAFPGEKYPVIMISMNEWNQFKGDIGKLLLQSNEPFILLACNMQCWPNDFLPHFKEHKVALFSLEESLEFRDNRFQPTEGWHQTMELFRKTLKPDNLVPAPPFEFRKKGDMWVIRFAGEDMYLKDSVGLRCLGQLLAKPDDPVFVSDLKMIIDGQNPQTLPAPTASGEMVDREYLKDVARKYLALEAEYKTAKETGELALAKELQEEMAKLMAFMQEAKGFGGRIKEANEKLNSIRISMYQAITRTLESIKVELPDCFSHLEPRITTGFILNYLPDKMVAWVI